MRWRAISGDGRARRPARARRAATACCAARRSGDRLFGGRGSDRLYGGDGRDVLRGGPAATGWSAARGGTCCAAGAATTRSGSRDGERDRVSCGPGRDRAMLDSADMILGRDGREARTEAARRVSRAAPQPDAFLVAAGDIADCTAGRRDHRGAAGRTARDRRGARRHRYENGTPDEFASCYEPTWGRHKARTRPAVGNHEYGTPGAGGYFAYFGAAAGEAGKGWYSYDLGAWHVVALNTNCTHVGGCQAGSEQERWLRADLARKPRRCTVAYMHHPRVQLRQPARRQPGGRAAVARAAGRRRGAGAGGPRPRLRALRSPDGRPARSTSQRGVRQFVVGTGGRPLRAFGPARAEQRGARQHRRLGRALTCGCATAATTGGSWASPAAPSRDAGTGTCH